MNKYIKKIEGTIPNTYKSININVDNSNLIIVGNNGSGKTSLLNELYKKVDLLIKHKKIADLDGMKKKLVEYENTLKTHKEGTSHHSSLTKAIENESSKIEQIESGLQLQFTDYLNFSSNVDKEKAIIKNFQSGRSAQIKHTNYALGIKAEIDTKKYDNNYGMDLEQHLVNLKNRSSLAITEDKNIDYAKKINEWFLDFEKNLQELMEDSSTKLNFDADTLKFTIVQDNKPPYTFQNLSSGYKSIFDIYSDLLMRTEYFSILPDEFEGTVFIDEIDAHLHVSLQRKIFPFLVKSFPLIQFIVTTHSPFVLMSLDDVKIFDISKNSLIEEDLSLYSYSSIMEGLFDTKPTSIILNDIILDIAKIVNEKPINYDSLTDLITKVKPNVRFLDIQSKVYYTLGLEALQNKES